MEQAGKRKFNKKNLALALLVVLVVTTALVAYAKFHKKVTATSPVVVNEVAEYHMDLVDVTDFEQLKQKLDVSEFNPGQNTEIVFAVRNGYEDEGGNKIHSDFNIEYELSLLYTSNLPLTYELYKKVGEEYVKLTNISKTVANPTNIYANEGTKELYTTDNSGNGFELIAQSSDISLDYYKLIIKWETDEQLAIDNKYVNEIDQIYLVVSAWQKE